MSFRYILEKIAAAPFETEPFRHVQIDNLFSGDHFSQLVAAPEIAVHAPASDESLFDQLFEKGYKIIDFPGCITDRETYLAWHRGDMRHNAGYNDKACEGFGMTLRLAAPSSPIVSDLVAFMNGEAFQAALATKFGINRDDVSYDAGIQKYLDGYEISPHPDARTKALTYMVNVNPSADSEDQHHHTHYLKLREAFKYVQAYWDGHPDEQRCWVPWDWCETVKVQRRNNSMVVFSPDNTTMHGVKARYDHLSGQRTQMYGNFWHRQRRSEPGPLWEDLVIRKAERPIA